jgi:hypothetical protein
VKRLLAARYETVRSDAVHAALLPFIPYGPDLIALDAAPLGSHRSATMWSLSSPPLACASRGNGGTRTPVQKPDPAGTR